MAFNLEHQRGFFNAECKENQLYHDLQTRKSYPLATKKFPLPQYFYNLNLIKNIRKKRHLLVGQLKDPLAWLQTPLTGLLDMTRHD